MLNEDPPDPTSFAWNKIVSLRRRRRPSVIERSDLEHPDSYSDKLLFLSSGYNFVRRDTRIYVYTYYAQITDQNLFIFYSSFEIRI